MRTLKSRKRQVAGKGESIRALAVMAALALPLLRGADKPNFSGTWELNIGRSSFDRHLPPERWVDRIAHKEPDLTIQASRIEGGGAREGTVRYKTYGTEGENTVMGNVLKYTAKWEGRSLVVATWGRFGANEMKLVDRWGLSGDGKIPTLLRHYEGMGGPQEQKLVLDKKEGQ